MALWQLMHLGTCWTQVHQLPQSDCGDNQQGTYTHIIGLKTLYIYADSKNEDFSIKKNFFFKKKKTSDLYISKLLGRFENVNHGLTGLTKVFGNYPCKETFEDIVKAELFNRIVAELFEDNTGNESTLILSSIKSVSGMFISSICHRIRY